MSLKSIGYIINADKGMLIYYVSYSAVDSADNSTSWNVYEK